MAPAIEISDERQRQAYDYYARHPSIPLRDIATFLGVSLSTFARLRERWGWPPREAAAASGGGPEGGAVAAQAEHPEGAAAPSSLRDAALALAKVTRSHIDALVREQRAGRVVDHDKTARALASYAKTLTTAQALLEQEGPRLDDTGHIEEFPRTIHELRDELARHLERIVAEEEARGSDGLLV